MWPLHLLFLLPGTFLSKNRQMAGFFTASRSFEGHFIGEPFLITPLNSPIRLNLPAFLAIHSLFSMAVLMPVCVLHSNVSSVKPESDLLFTALCLAPHKSMPGTEYAFKNIC